MPKIGPIKRRDVIRYFKRLGFVGPLPGGKHEYMVRGLNRVIIPNPHQGEISQAFLLRLLKEANITREEWESL
ncbi:MAG TPA: type II toxin-antitoxin system HicA family toxin [Ktedonobacterales bacterium]